MDRVIGARSAGPGGVSLRLCVEMTGTVVRGFSPPAWDDATIRRRLRRRDVDGPIRRSRADGRRLEGEPDGSSSRGTAAYATAGLPAMAPSWSGA